MSGSARTTIEESARTNPTATASATACLDGRLIGDLAVSGAAEPSSRLIFEPKYQAEPKGWLTDAQIDQDPAWNQCRPPRPRGDERLRVDRVAKLDAARRNRERADHDHRVRLGHRLQ